MASQWMVEPARRIPVQHEVDVAVVGGGTAGAVAAIAAARTGASAALIERFGTLGGCVTIGRCFHANQRFVDVEGRRTITGLPVEVFERVARAGGMPYPTLWENINGRSRRPMFLQVDPEVLSVILLEMCEEAGVKLMLHTDCYDTLTTDGRVSGVLVHNKAGRAAVLAQTVVDASGEADVAYAAGAPCKSGGDPGQPPMGNTFGLLIRLGGVDLDSFMDYFLSLPAGRADPGYEAWLSRRTGLTPEALRSDRYWRHFLDPQPVSGIPAHHPGAETFGPQTLEYYRQVWTEDGVFTYVQMHFFRDLLRQAVDAGEFELLRNVEGFGAVGFNFDGITGGKWRDGEVLINAINPMRGFDAFDSEHISKVEVAARQRTFELHRFLRKYMPGYEASHVVDTGAQTMPRHPREIHAEYSLTLEELRATDGYDDAICVVTYGRGPGVAHEVPYRMMVPRQVDGVLVAGKCADGAHHVRSIPSTMAIGQAVGVAAALCAKDGVQPRRLDVARLQAELARQGVVYKLQPPTERTW